MSRKQVVVDKSLVAGNGVTGVELSVKPVGYGATIDSMLLRSDFSGATSGRNIMEVSIRSGSTVYDFAWFRWETDEKVAIFTGGTFGNELPGEIFTAIPGIRGAYIGPESELFILVFCSENADRTFEVFANLTLD